MNKKDSEKLDECERLLFQLADYVFIITDSGHYRHDGDIYLDKYASEINKYMHET